MTEANEAIDMTEYYPDSLIRANELHAQKKGKENEQIKSYSIQRNFR